MGLQDAQKGGTGERATLSACQLGQSAAECGLNRVSSSARLNTPTLWAAHGAGGGFNCLFGRKSRSCGLAVVEQRKGRGVGLGWVGLGWVSAHTKGGSRGLCVLTSPARMGPDLRLSSLTAAQLTVPKRHRGPGETPPCLCVFSACGGDVPLSQSKQECVADILNGPRASNVSATLPVRGRRSGRAGGPTTRNQKKIRSTIVALNECNPLRQRTGCPPDQP